MKKSFAIMRMYDNGEIRLVVPDYKTKSDAEKDMIEVINRYSFSGYYFIMEVYEHIL